jgi:hypothetical protein
VVAELVPEDGCRTPEPVGLVVEVVGNDGSGLMPAALAGATKGWFPGSPDPVDELFPVEPGGSTL